VARAGRVVAGRARGIVLAGPGAGTRPLADRVKQSLFGALEPILPGAAVLDLCAGSGAAGIEALSRGAARAVFVERDADACRAIAENLRRTALTEAATVLRRDAAAALADLAAAGETFDLVIVDPPYPAGELRAAILDLLAAPESPLKPTGEAIVTSHWREPPDSEIGLLRSTRVRRFGETAITFYRRDPVAAPAGASRTLPEGGGSMRTAVYPGSFDPITLGHLDVLRRAAAVFDRVVVAVLVNPRKAPAGEAGARAAAVRDAVAETLAEVAARVEVEVFDGLTVEACRAVGATHVVRGLRAVSDFEAELQMAHMNRRLAPEIDTVFFMTALEHGYLSSSLVREIARFGGDVSAMVPPSVAARLGESKGEEPRL
jgi:pantetheine-phosphate adenylyltransferase